MLFVTTAAQPHDITSFGAVAGVDTHAQALLNGAAFAAAVRAANSSAAGSRVVLVPADSVFSFLPAQPDLPGLVDVTILIEGELSLNTGNLSAYPGWPDRTFVPLSFGSATGLTIASATGRGVVNGRGNLWWWRAILVEDNRPNLFEASGNGITISGVTFLNSPAWHVWLAPVQGAVIVNSTVRVDIADQVDVYRYTGGSPVDASLVDVLRAAELLGPASDADAAAWVERGGSLADRARDGSVGSAELRAARIAALPLHVRAAAWFAPSWAITPPIPMIYALNTDGFDVSGVDISVTNCSVTNFDDSVCVKPSSGYPPNGCTRDVRIADIAVTYGVGVSMGSVPPDVGGDCIDGVTASRLSFDTPLKAMYVKPNPARDGGASGAIVNVVYEDVVVRDALWWPIWVGTQQQHQPGSSSGTGCPFYFPLLNSTCPTDPEVTLANITFRRVDIFGGLLSPGILIANASNPGTGFVFDAVVAHNASTWPVKGGYLVANVNGVATGGTSPVPVGFSQ